MVVQHRHLSTQTSSTTTTYDKKYLFVSSGPSLPFSKLFTSLRHSGPCLEEQEQTHGAIDRENAENSARAKDLSPGSCASHASISLLLSRVASSYCSIANVDLHFAISNTSIPFAVVPIATQLANPLAPAASALLS